MITRNTDYSIQHLRGLSTDTKPTDVPNGSEFREMDTGKDYMFDETSGDWKEQPKKGGGGGGGGKIMLLTPTETGIAETFNQIVTAIESGELVIMYANIADGSTDSYGRRLMILTSCDKDTMFGPPYRAALSRFEPDGVTNTALLEATGPDVPLQLHHD